MEAKPASGATTFGCNHRLLLVGQLTLSYLEITKGPKHHFHEIENDLIAGHYHSHGRPPSMQFSNLKVVRAKEQD